MLNIIVTAVYTAGISATMYASALAPELARTATTLSGVGTVLLVILIDPVSALITDQALRGSRLVSEVSHIVIWEVVGRFRGTLLAQVIFFPASLLVVHLARLLV